MLLLVEHIFSAVLRTALPGSLCILAVLAARLALRRMPARFSYLLWAVVVFRLACPAPPAAPFGLLPSSLPASLPASQSGQSNAALGTANTPTEMDGGGWAVPGTAAAAGSAANAGGAAGGVTGRVPSPAPDLAPAPGMGMRQWAAVVWLAAALLLLGWQLASLARLSLRMQKARRQLAGNGAGQKVVRLPGLESSFLFGLPRLRVYLPAGLDPGQERMILLHEQAHLRRGDWLVRPLAWVLVCVYWFDPLVWLAWCLAMQDMERCCDEAALRALGPGERQNYARTLLGMAAGRQIGPWAPAFGQGEIKGRIRHLLQCTTPARWVLGLAAAGVAAVCAVLAFSPAGRQAPEIQADELAGWVYQYEKDGFGGDFTVSLEADGSFMYYEGGLSSYIGIGSWELDGSILTLRDDTTMGYPFVNRFEVKDGSLIFREEGSTNFLYLKVADGERFSPVRRTEAEDTPQPDENKLVEPEAVLTGPDGSPLSFWIKPDEPLQVLGTTAATVWLNAKLDESVPDTERLAGYSIQSVRATEGTPPAGQSREELPYQYLVRISYDITTASEAYSAPGDGIAGLGTFAGLYRELGVKELEQGSYAIVSVGTGGGAAIFAADPELEEAIRQTLLGMYADPNHPDAMMVESHTTLYWEEVGTEPRAVRVYLLAMVKGEIGLTDGAGGLMQPREQFGPVRLTLIWMGAEGWAPMEVWMLRQPEDTEAWHQELAEMFPDQAITALLADSSQTLDQRRDRLRAACDAVLFGTASQAASQGPVLQFYDSFRDIPFVDLEYVYDPEYGVCKGELDKNGEPWCAAPGLMEFGERCFTDGTRLWIQVFINPSDNDAFDWFHVCFDHFDNDMPWTDITTDTGDPPQTQWIRPLENRMLTHADGYTVYTDDGFFYTVEPCPAMGGPAS